MSRFNAQVLYTYTDDDEKYGASNGAPAGTPYWSDAGFDCDDDGEETEASCHEFDTLAESERALRDCLRNSPDARAWRVLELADDGTQRVLREGTMEVRP